MNKDKLDYLSLEEIKEALDWHVKHMFADVTDRVLGPVVESDYDVNFDSDWYGILVKEGLHRITYKDGQPIAYSGPGEEG